MDIDQIRYFCAIVKAGSLRQASEILRLSSPALSKSMRLLQEELGYRLFIPSGRNIIITDEGREFFQRSVPVVSEFEKLLSGSTAEKKKENFRIGSFEVFTTHFIRKLLPHADWINREIFIYEMLPGEIEDSLVKREIDIGLTYIPVPKSDLDFLKIGDIEMGIYQKKGGKFHLLDFEKMPFVVPVAPLHETPTKVRGLDGWPDHKVKRNQRYHVVLLESGLELCRQGLAVGYFPKFVIDSHNATVKPEFELIEIKTEKKLTSMQGVYLIKRKTDLESKDIKILAKNLRQHCIER